jgi:hypothetical protein
MGGKIKMDKKDESNAAIGLAIGAGVGITIGTLTGNIAVWMPIGAVLGLIFGGYWKSLTRQDKSRKDVVK